MHNQQMNAKHKQIENSRAIMNKYKYKKNFSLYGVSSIINMHIMNIQVWHKSKIG